LIRLAHTALAAALSVASASLAAAQPQSDTEPEPEPDEPRDPGDLDDIGQPPGPTVPEESEPRAEDEEPGAEPLDPTLAEEGDLPAGKWGLIGALRQNIGELGDSYGFGWLWGFAAGYQPTRPGDAFSFGLDWSVLFGRSYASQPTIPDDPLLAVEMSFGTRVRTALGEEAPRFLVGSAGLTLLRTNVPVPPDGDRLYVGGYGGFGVEQYVLGDMLVGLDARFGLFGDGPVGLTLMLSIAFGAL
jgi:hypothetical protein